MIDRSLVRLIHCHRRAHMDNHGIALKIVPIRVLQGLKNSILTDSKFILPNLNPAPLSPKTQKPKLVNS